MGIADVVDGKVAEAAEVVETPAIEAPAAAVETPIVETPAEGAETLPASEAPAVDAAKEDKSVPLPVFLDMRDKLKDAERRLAEATPRAPAKVPDPYDDPKGFDAHYQGELDRRLEEQKLAMSWHLAVRDHGQEKAEKARDWAVEKAKSDPLFGQQLETAFKTQALPIDWIVRQHRRDSLAGQLPEDVSSIEELVEREIAKRGLSVAPAAVAVASQPAPVTPPRGLASAPSKGGGVKDVPIGPMAALSSLEAIVNR